MTRGCTPPRASGPARVDLACRPATAITWIHDHLYDPSTAPGGVGHCGFCITGNSGGASQVSYALAFYGLEGILDAVIPTSGPPHAAQGRGCLDDAFSYSDSNRRNIDAAWGYFDDTGPCFVHGQGYDFEDEWQRHSVESGGTDYVHPETRVHLIFGGRDRTSAVPQGQIYAQTLRDHGSPMVKVTLVPEMAHGIGGSPEGLAVLHAALLA